MEELHPLVVLASPYKRCVQTAFSICKGLQNSGRHVYKDTIYICFQAQEYLNQKNKLSRGELLSSLKKFE